MANTILQCIEKLKIEAMKLCIRSCTTNSFLCFVLHKALRDEDHSKPNMLGPFCLLRNDARFPDDFFVTVCRGRWLSKDEMNGYKETVGQWKAWATFTSTSEDRGMARFFGDSLFIIEILLSKST